MSDFEKWFIQQDFYTNMRFIHGDALFLRDGFVYRVLPVQMTFVAWVEKQSEIDQLKAEKAGLEKRLKQAESKTLMAMIHGTCECGTAWSPIVSDKEGFSLLHCFDCGNNRYENIEVFGDYSLKAPRGEQ